MSRDEDDSQWELEQAVPTEDSPSSGAQVVHQAALWHSSDS